MKKRLVYLTAPRTPTRTSILSLPNELLGRILDEIPAVEVVLCRRVGIFPLFRIALRPTHFSQICYKFKDIVDDSSIFWPSCQNNQHGLLNSFIKCLVVQCDQMNSGNSFPVYGQIVHPYLIYCSHTATCNEGGRLIFQSGGACAFNKRL